MEFTMGCDPELFLWDNLLQRIVPAVGKVGGSKYKPMKLDGGMVQLDGSVVEFGIDPARTADEFVANIDKVIAQIRDKLQNRFHGRYDLRCGAIAGYHPDDIAENAEALEVGCSPQFRWQGNDLVRIPSTGDRLDRDAVPVGGHLHFGFGVNMPIHDESLVVACKRFVTEYNIAVTTLVTQRDERREAVMGMNTNPAVRIKPYGVEYRNKSSIWLANRELAKEYFKLGETVFNNLLAGREAFVRTPSVRRTWDVVKSAEAAVPDKYQGTLPLDF